MKLKQYPKYKESGVQWVGKIPEGWKINKIKHLCSKNSEYGSGGSSEDYEQEGIRLIRITDIDEKKGLISDGVYLPKKNVNKEMILKTGDILLARSGSVGISFYYDKEKYQECTFAGYLVRFRTDYLKENKFLYYFTKSKSFHAQIESNSVQTTIENFNAKKYSDIVLAIPPTNEQSTIVYFLDKKTSKLNKILNKLNSLKQYFKEKRLALIGNLILDENIPKIRLEHIAEKVLRPILKTEKESYTPLGLYNRGRGIFHKNLTEEQDLGDSKFFFVKEGDFIISGQFAWEGAVSIANKEQENCVISHRFHILNGKLNQIKNEYLWALFTSDFGDFLLNQCSIGSAGRNRPLNINLLMKEKIPVPSSNVQERIKKIVHKEKELGDLIKKITLLLEEYKKSLIHHVVTGKVDVRSEK